MPAVVQRILRYLALIDLRALSGLHRMLGVEMGEGAIRLTEVARRGMPFSKLSSRFETLASVEVPQAPGDSPDAIGKKIAQSLESARISTKTAVFGIRSKDVRTVETTIPPSVRDSNLWISERMTELLKLPVAGNQFSFRWQPIQDEESGNRVRITFARTSELERVRLVAAGAGLKVIAHLPETEADVPSINGLLRHESESPRRKSVSLAISGFLPELIRSDFTTPAEQEERESGVAKRLFQRVALATGSLLLILLLVDTVVSRLLMQRLKELDERGAALAPRVAQVEKLQWQVALLETRLHDRTSTLARTEVSRILHAVGTATPRDVRLLRIGFQEQDGRVVTLAGFAEREEGVTRLLKDLAQTGSFAGVQLLRSGMVTREEGVGAAHTTARDRCEFEIRTEWVRRQR